MTSKKRKMIHSTDNTPILAIDLIRSILERLNFVDFHRARCVSSAWYTASESCIHVTNPTTPWIILFSKEDTERNNGTSCKLFDPRDKSSYTVKDLGSGFARSRCLSSSGSWFLMLGHKTNLYLFNMFTRQKIPLPSVKTAHGYDKSITIGSAVLWVDEKSRDYFVVWNFDNTFAYHKRGDNIESWKVFEPLETRGYRGYVDMVYKEGKLYVLTPSGNVTVYDFSSGDSPLECEIFPSIRLRYDHYDGRSRHESLKNLAVTLSGEVLVITRVMETFDKTCFFQVYKMDLDISIGSTVTESIGDQVLLLDMGITVAAKDKKNCIYMSDNDQFRRYSKSQCNNDNGICIYHIGTSKVVQLFDHLTAFLPMHSSAFKDARWFSPTFGQKWLH